MGDSIKIPGDIQVAWTIKTKLGRSLRLTKVKKIVELRKENFDDKSLEPEIVEVAIIPYRRYLDLLVDAGDVRKKRLDAARKKGSAHEY